MNVKLVWITPNTEKLIGYIARVSNPRNQNNPEIQGLLQYCIRHRHWSPFEMASMCVEIETSRAIAAQILRHRSFSFQEFSQRYADASQLGFESVELRKQAEKNRQSSTETINPVIHEWTNDAGELQFYYGNDAVNDHLQNSLNLYNRLLEEGTAKESARMILPLATTTRLYMVGTIRSWIHYLELRTGDDVQKEHRAVAEAIRDTIFIPWLPIISSALGWPQP